MVIAIINGPNLNLLGEREPDIYGHMSFDTYFEKLKREYKNIQLNYYQSNIEGEIINFLQESARAGISGIILNAGGYTHTSIAIADTLAAIKIPCIEVHISNIWSREEFRRTSYIASKCIGNIGGLGLAVYRLAIEYFTQQIEN